MYLEAKETARLYKVLTEKLGSETTEAMFKYIDNKAERAVEATIKTLATKEDITDVRRDLTEFKVATKEDIAAVKYELSNKIANSIRWSFVFWIGQAATTIGIVYLILKK